MDIIKLAEKVNIFVAKENLIEPRHAIIPQYDLQQFANLILEEAAKKCEEGVDNAGNWDSDYWNQACENRAIAIRKMKSKEE